MDHVLHSFRSTRTPLAFAALSGCVTFLLFGARLTDAGPAVVRPHGAVSADVSVDGGLVKEGQGWAIQFRAVNAGALIERCKVAASVTKTIDDPMARVLQAPREIWSTSVTLTVPAKGESLEKLQIPGDAARQIKEQRLDGPVGTGRTAERIERRTESYDVRFSAKCDKTPGDVT